MRRALLAAGAALGWIVLALALWTAVPALWDELAWRRIEARARRRFQAPARAPILHSAGTP